MATLIQDDIYAAGYQTVPSDWTQNSKIARTSNGDLHIVVRDQSEYARQFSYFKSTDNGLTWGDRLNLTTDGDHYGIGVMDDDTIHIVWTDTIGALRHKMFNGSWQTTENVNTNWNVAQPTSVAVSKNSITAAAISGAQDTIAYHTYFEGSWGTEETVTLAAGLYAQSLDLEHDSGNDCYAVFAQSSGSAWDRIIFGNINNLATTGIEVFVENNGSVERPQLIFDSSDTAHVTFYHQDNTAGLYKIDYTKKALADISFAAPTTIKDDDVDTLNMGNRSFSLSADGHIHVILVIIDSVFGYSITYCEFDGATWTETLLDTNINVNGGYVYQGLKGKSSFQIPTNGYLFAYNYGDGGDVSLDSFYGYADFSTTPPSSSKITVTTTRGKVIVAEKIGGLGGHGDFKYVNLGLSNSAPSVEDTSLSAPINEGVFVVTEATLTVEGGNTLVLSSQFTADTERAIVESGVFNGGISETSEMIERTTMGVVSPSVGDKLNIVHKIVIN